MKKEKTIVFLLSASILVNLVFFVFASIQKAAADTARQEAIANEIKARENEMRCLEVQRSSEMALKACEQQRVSGQASVKQ